MAIYDAGTASMTANGIVTGVGTSWQQPLTLIRVGATMVFKTNPVTAVTVAEIISDTSIRAFNTKSTVVPAGTQYFILAHDGITVQGLAQDVAETLRYYQSQETSVASLVQLAQSGDFDFDRLETLVNEAKSSETNAASSASSAAASQQAAATSQAQAESSASSAQSAYNNTVNAIANAGDASTLVTLSGWGIGSSSGMTLLDSLDFQNFTFVIGAYYRVAYSNVTNAPPSLVVPTTATLVINVTSGGSVNNRVMDVATYTASDNNFRKYSLSYNGAPGSRVFYVRESIYLPGGSEVGGANAQRVRGLLDVYSKAESDAVRTIALGGTGATTAAAARENLDVFSRDESRPQLKSSSYPNLLDAITDAVSKGYDLLIDRAENITQPIRLSLSGRDFSIKSTSDGWINFTPSNPNTYYQVLTFDGTGVERLITEVKIDGGKVRGVGRAILGIASNYVAYHKESSEMRNISAGVNCTGAKLHECVGAYYYNVFQQLASQDWSAGVYGYGCVPIDCKTVVISGCTFGIESMPLDRHAVYSSSRDDGTGYNDFVFVSKNNCYMRDYSSETAETTFERCFKFIGTKNVVVDSNVVIGGYGGVLITCRKDDRVNYVGVSNNSFRVFSSGVEVSYQDAAAQNQSTATWSVGTLKVNDNRFDLTTNASGISNGIAWRNVDKVYDFNNYYTQLSYPSSTGLTVFYPRSDRIRSSLFISKGSHYSGFNNITREMAPTVTSIELTCQNAVSSQTPLNATGANNQYAFVRSIDGSASWRTYTGSSIPGFRYFDSTLNKVIYNTGTGTWNDESGFLSVGTLASRPDGVPVNFRYWEVDQSRYVVWTGSTWVLSTKSFSPTPLAATTAQIKAIDKTILGYGHVVYDTTAKKPAFFDQLAQAWRYADGTAI
ncbi:tail fiber protein [Escherichia phage Phagiculus]